jgi:hypothetical protein
VAFWISFLNCLQIQRFRGSSFSIFCYTKQQNPFCFFNHVVQCERLWGRSQDQICSQKKSPILRTFSRNSEFWILFYCTHAWGCGWIHKSPTAIFSQPTILTNIWTAHFGKETWKEKPPRLRCSKMPKNWKEKSAEMSCVHFTRLLDVPRHYLKKFQELRILRKSSENRDFFLEKIWSCNRRERRHPSSLIAATIYT